MDIPSIEEMNKQPVEALSYEDAFTQLEQIVAALEAETFSLETTVALYERGQALARHCADLLDNVELKVEMLSGEKLVDFAADDQV